MPKCKSMLLIKPAQALFTIHCYPYWFADADGDGAADQNQEGAVRFSTWTARLLKAAYNYQVHIRTPVRSRTATSTSSNCCLTRLQTWVEIQAPLPEQMPLISRATQNRSVIGMLKKKATAQYRWMRKCHTATGLPAYVSTGGKTVVTSTGTTAIVGLGAMPAGNGFLCTTCHTDPGGGERYQVSSVIFPSGKTVSFGGQDADGNFLPDDSNLCISCHQGRESTTSMNNALRGKEPDTVDAKIRFKNIHYFAAGATIFGADVQGAYMYEGKEYASQNLHASPEGKMNKCKDCHDVHALEPKVEACAACHDTTDPTTIRISDADYDGDGDVTEGIKGEVDTLAEALYAEIQKYAEAHGGAIKYDSIAYPYFFGADGEGYPPGLPIWKSGIQLPIRSKGPGAYVHNPKL